MRLDHLLSRETGASLRTGAPTHNRSLAEEIGSTGRNGNTKLLITSQLLRGRRRGL